MKYPTISPQELEHLSAALLAGNTADVAAAIKWVGEGPEVDLIPLEQTGQQLRQRLSEIDDLTTVIVDDGFEGGAAGDVHAALRGLPLRTLDDAGFWRYVSACHLWEVAVARQRSTFASNDWGRFRKYVDGTSPAECVAHRMYIRGQLTFADGEYALASAVPRAADLWRSHIYRVRMSYSPVLTQAIIRQQVENRMKADDLRPFVSRVTRLRSNVILDLYDAEEADKLLEELDHRDVSS